MVGDVRKVILRAGGLIVELVGAVGQLAGGVAAVGAVQAAVSVGGDVLAAHVELDIVELSLAVGGPGVLQEVDEVARGQLDGIVDADGVGDVFLDNGDDDVDVIVDLVGLSAVGLFNLAVDAEGQGDGVLGGLGDGLEGHLVHVGVLSLAVGGGSDLAAAVIQRALALGGGEAVQRGVVEGDLVLLGVVIAIVLGIILEEALEVLLVEAHALARDNIVVDVVGLLGDGDRTGGSDVVINSDNIEGSLAVLVERAGRNGIVLVLGHEFPIGVAAGLAPVAVILLGSEVGARVNIERIVIAVGKGHGLVGRSAGHGVLDVLVAVDADGQGNSVTIIDNQLERGIADVAFLGSNGQSTINAVAGSQGGTIILESQIARCIFNKLNAGDIIGRERRINIVNCVFQKILQLTLGVLDLITVGNGRSVGIKGSDVDGVLNSILCAAELNGSNDLCSSLLETGDIVTGDLDNSAVTAVLVVQALPSNSVGSSIARTIDDLAVGLRLDTRSVNVNGIAIGRKAKSGLAIVGRDCLIGFSNNGVGLIMRCSRRRTLGYSTNNFV